MRAVVPTAPRTMHVVDMATPGSPGPGQVTVRSEAVGICGSDLHIFDGSTGRAPERTYPVVQGHELSAVIEDVGPGCAPGLEPGRRVAVWPVVACRSCHACRAGRPTVCASMTLVGVHIDGGLQDRLTVRAEQVVPVGPLDPGCTAFVEPTSVAVRAVRLAAPVRDAPVVVFGAGAIGLAGALALTRAGAVPLVVDPVPARRRLAEELGLVPASRPPADGLAADVRRWAGGQDAPVVIDTTGDPGVLPIATHLVAAGGRVVLVGLAGAPAALRPDLVVKKEVQVLGSSCSERDDFCAAAALVAENAGRVRQLVTHRFPPERAGEAMTAALTRRDDVLKVLITLGQA